jgi:Ca-activated chloride channel family protein
MMTFAQPGWIGIGIASAAGLSGLIFLAARRRQAALLQMASPHLLVPLTASLSPGRRRLKQALLFGAVLGLCVALARPQAGFRFEEVKREGADVLFAVDTSRSMLARDVRPDRLTRAKLAVSDLLSRMAGDRVGLLAFAGEAFVQCPLTLDENAFRESLDALDTGIIPRGGTNLAAAIHAAQQALMSEPRNRKLLVLFTDGEDLDARGVAAARVAAKEGLRIFTVGVGTAAGELIPIPTEGGGEALLRDASGSPVRSRLDEPTLRRIAEVSGGVYQPLGAGGEGLDALYARYLANLPRRELSAQLERVPIDYFAWPLGLALFCLLLEALLGERRRTTAAFRQGFCWPLWKAPALGIPLLAVLGLSGVAQASPARAEADYRRGDFHAAWQEYQNAAQRAPGRPELRYNVGAAAYRSGDFAKAAGAFAEAIEVATERGRPDLKEQAYYDLGNAQFRQGEQALSSDREQTRAAWEQAKSAYESALKLRPDDADAHFNLELTKQRLTQLEEKQPDPAKKNPPDSQKQDKNQSGADKKEAKGSSNQADSKGQSDQADAQNQSKGKDRNQGSGSSPGKDSQARNQKQGSAQNQGPASPPEQKSQAAGTVPGRNAVAQAGAGQVRPASAQRGSGESRGAQGSLSPDSLSKEEALGLLDSLSGEDRRLSPSALRAGPPVPEPEPGKDW